MAAEPDQTRTAEQTRHLSLVALYAREEDANELLVRLGALSIDTSDATIVRVDNSTPAPNGNQISATFSPRLRSTMTGAIIGSALSFVAGFLLYEIGMLSFPADGGLFATVLAATLFGASAGAAIGSLSAVAGLSSGRAQPAAIEPGPGRFGFLVVIRVPLHLAEQSESIARRLGAKEIIL